MYDATKAFLLNFSESLHLILHATPVRVQALCPGFTRSDFHMKLGMDDAHPIFTRHKFMSARQVVEASLRCLARDRVVCLPGWRTRLKAWLSRIAPRKMLYAAYLRRRGLR
jgi:short-subunit dehydrogenase